MPHITEESLTEVAERQRRILNTRFGFHHSLGLLLERCLGHDEAEKALAAAHDRDFDTFLDKTREIKGKGRHRD